MTAADQQDRAQVETLAEAVQKITGQHVQLAYVDQGYTDDNAARDYERLAATLGALHYLAFACIMPANLVKALAQT